MVNTVALLAPRLRVEERLLTQAFADAGVEAQLLDATALALPLAGPFPSFPRLVLERDVATADRVLLAALLAANGIHVVNRTATTRLLADRLALLRHLVFAGIPTPTAVLAFGEAAALAAVERIGFPAVIRTLQVQPHVPDAVVIDADIADAVLEHRAMLGHESTVLVQQHAVGPTVRAAIVGAEIVALEPVAASEYMPFDGVDSQPLALAQQVLSRVGTGVYDVRLTETDAGWLVSGVHNLTEFRSIQSAGHDIAGAIARYTLSHLEGA